MSDVDATVLEQRVRTPTVRLRVLDLCKQYPSVKGDYRLLYWRYYKTYCGLKMSSTSFKAFFDALRDAPSPETIGRRYRELVEGGCIEALPTEGTQHKRWRNSVVYKDYYGQKALFDYGD